MPNWNSTLEIIDALVTPATKSVNVPVPVMQGSKLLKPPFAFSGCGPIIRSLLLATVQPRYCVDRDGRSGATTDPMIGASRNGDFSVGRCEID